MAELGRRCTRFLALWIAHFFKCHNLAMMDTNDDHHEMKICANGNRVMKVPVKEAEDKDESFQLRQEYQNAVNCLIRCEFIIKSLQEEVASKDVQLQTQLVAKDGQIASLEEKIVAMSLELASLKGMDDEHRLQGYKRGQVEQVQQNYALVSCRAADCKKSRTSDAETSKKPQAQADDRKDSFMTWPEEDNSGSDGKRPRSSRIQPEPRRRGGFRLVNDLAQVFELEGPAILGR